MTHIKALPWMALKLDLPVFESLQSQTVSDFLKSQTRIPFERAEANPACSSCGMGTKNLIRWITSTGNYHTWFLPNRHHGISQIPRLTTNKTCWRTKTSVSGQPWGVCCLGIVTRPSTKHWVFPFLEAVQIGIDKSRNHWGPQWSPDFLFPSWTDTIPFSSPCSYHHALALIRFYSQCTWLTPPLLLAEQAIHLSIHSMKSTLLAAAGQLNLNLEQRAKQGHHKKFVQLYSRDDVWPSLFLSKGHTRWHQYRLETFDIAIQMIKSNRYSLTPTVTTHQAHPHPGHPLRMRIPIQHNHQCWW